MFSEGRGFKNEIIRSFLDSKQIKERRIQMLEFLDEHRDGGEIILYRAENLHERPELNEDPAGQVGRGVYFAVDPEMARIFRPDARNRSIFKVAIDYVMFLKMQPIFFSDEDINLLQHMDVEVIKEVTEKLGYLHGKSCVIVPMPDFGFEYQVIIAKPVLRTLLQIKAVKCTKIE
jgi:hypothetical protein